MVTNEELIELGKKMLAQKAKDKAKARAVTHATQKLVAAHRAEYEKYLAEEKA